MLLLAIDTSSAAVTTAVHDGDRVLAESTALDGRRHAELLAPAVEQALAEAGAAPADLTVIAVGVGPGPFTGLRVGLVTARTLALVLDIEVHGVCSLDVVAAAAGASGGSAAGGRGAVPDAEFLVATDARRREVYWARYETDDGTPVRVEGPQVSLPAEVPRGGLPVVGRGTALYPDVLGPERPPMEPSADVLAALAAARLTRGGELLAPEPLYLRRPDAQEPVARKRVLSR